MAPTGNRRPTSAPTRSRRAGGGHPPAPRAPAARPDVSARARGGRLEAAVAGGRQRGRRLFRGSTRRLVVLGAVFVLLAVMLVPTIRAFFAQRDSNVTLAGRVSRQQATVDALRQEIDRYSDPAYVQQQARARLGYVKPGETSWRVVGGPDGQTGGTVSAGVAIPADPQGQKAYYEKVWSSIILADKATPAPAPAAPR